VLQLINRFISAGVAKQSSPAGAAAAAQARVRCSRHQSFLLRLQTVYKDC
jgi:hypothetical protein